MSAEHNLRNLPIEIIKSNLIQSNYILRFNYQTQSNDNQTLPDFLTDFDCVILHKIVLDLFVNVVFKKFTFILLPSCIAY